MITNDFGHPIVKGTIDKRMKSKPANPGKVYLFAW